MPMEQTTKMEKVRPLTFAITERLLSTIQLMVENWNFLPRLIHEKQKYAIRLVAHFSHKFHAYSQEISISFSSITLI